jgi:hypothetical protein
VNGQSGPAHGLTVMWEARAADGRGDELVAFVAATAHPDALIYRTPVVTAGAGASSAPGGEVRVVVIDASGQGIADVPADLIARPAQAWPFQPVDR